MSGRRELSNTRNGSTIVRNRRVPSSGRSFDATDWLLREGWRLPSPQEFIRTLCDHLVQQGGVHLSRMFCLVRVLHPQVSAETYTWRRRTGAVETVSAPCGMLDSALFRESPCAALFEGKAAIRRRLDVPVVRLDYPVLRDLKAEGATDYVAMPVPFADGQINVVSFGTDRRGGFTAADLEVLNGILPAFGPVLDFQTMRRTTVTLLSAYLGRRTGERVLRGLVRLGDGEVIRSVICFCDLRDSTHLADTLPRPEFLAILNQFFDAAARPILEHGGEVLQYNGDAVLAIFPIADPINPGYRHAKPVPEACENALAAANHIVARFAELNRQRERSRLGPLGYGLAVHEGEVTYGNIGVPERLAFTVVGPAANEAARLADMCKTLMRPILLSEEFARCFPGQWVSLGKHTLRGVGTPQEVFTLPE